MLEIVSFRLGPAQTNAYLVADSDTRDAAVLDPAWDGHLILEAAQTRGWRIAHLWYTHAHFDHIGNVRLFPNVKWIVQKKEHAAMFGPDRAASGW